MTPPSQPPADSPLRASGLSDGLHGVTWLLLRDGYVLLERCPKKAQVLGVGEWFVPGGKIERLPALHGPLCGVKENRMETDDEALRREIREEWPTAELTSYLPLPILEGSAVPPGPRGLFLMRPYLVTVTFDGSPDGLAPVASGDGVPLRWVSIGEALDSPVPQVRMMVAAARRAEAPIPLPEGAGEPTPRCIGCRTVLDTGEALAFTLCESCWETRHARLHPEQRHADG